MRSADLSVRLCLQQGSLLILDVHARDVVEEMVELKTSSVSDFQWMKQLRYQWVTDEKVCRASVYPFFPKPFAGR